MKKTAVHSVHFVHLLYFEHKSSPRIFQRKQNCTEVFRSAQVHFLHFLHCMHFVYFFRKKCALQKSEQKVLCTFQLSLSQHGKTGEFPNSFIPPYTRKSNKKTGSNNLQTCSLDRGWAPWKKCKKCKKWNPQFADEGIAICLLAWCCLGYCSAVYGLAARYESSARASCQ